MDSNLRISKASRPESPRKKCFNLEDDVLGMFAKWKAENPNIIESRMFNAALRGHLQAFKRVRKARVAA
jgi:hypothetical protein